MIVHLLGIALGLGCGTVGQSNASRPSTPTVAFDEPGAHHRVVAVAVLDAFGDEPASLPTSVQTLHPGMATDELEKQFERVRSTEHVYLKRDARGLALHSIRLADHPALSVSAVVSGAGLTELSVTWDGEDLDAALASIWAEPVRWERTEKGPLPVWENDVWTVELRSIDDQPVLRYTPRTL